MLNILYLDIFAEETSFIVRGKKHYRTWTGVLLSIVLIIASIILTFLFGQEVYQRKRPDVSNSVEYLKNSRVEMLDYPVYILASDYNGVYIENIDDYFTFKTYKMNFTVDGFSDFAEVTPFHPVVKCESKHFEVIKDKITQEEINHILEIPSYCIDYDEQAFLQNPYKTKNSTFLDIDVDLCDPSVKKCGDDYEFVIKEAYIQLYFLNTYIDSQDFSNPVKYYYEGINTQITNTYLKRNFISVHTNEYISDDGWILEALRSVEYYSLGNIKSEVNSIAPSEPLSVLWNTIDCSYLKTKTNRIYMKIQDLFAKIGGIVNAFVIIIQIFFSHFFRYNFNMKLREYLNPSDKNYYQKRSYNLFNINSSVNDFNSNNVFLTTNKNNVLGKNPYTNKSANVITSKSIGKMNLNYLNNNKNLNINSNTNRTKRIFIDRYDNPDKYDDAYFHTNSIKNKVTNYEDNNSKNSFKKDLNYIDSKSKRQINKEINNNTSIKKKKNTISPNKNNKKGEINLELSIKEEQVPNFKNELKITKTIPKKAISKSRKGHKRANDNNALYNYSMNKKNKSNSNECKDSKLSSDMRSTIKEQDNNYKYGNNIDNFIINTNTEDVKNINNINKMSNKSKLSIKNVDLRSECDTNNNTSDISIFKFEFVDFSNLSYLKYIFYKVTCNIRRSRIYDSIRNEVESLLDFYVYCNYLKHQYLLKDPRELQE